MITSGRSSLFFKNLIKCCQTFHSEDLSVDKILGLKKGVFAPNFLEMEAIFLLSVETITLSIFFNERACCIE